MNRDVQFDSNPGSKFNIEFLPDPDCSFSKLTEFKITSNEMNTFSKTKKNYFFFMMMTGPKQKIKEFEFSYYQENEVLRTMTNNLTTKISKGYLNQNGFMIRNLKLEFLKIQLYPESLQNEPLSSLSRTLTFNILFWNLNSINSGELILESSIVDPIIFSMWKIQISCKKGSLKIPPTMYEKQKIKIKIFDRNNPSQTYQIIDEEIDRIDSSRINLVLRITMLPKIFEISSLSSTIPNSATDFRIIIEAYASDIRWSQSASKIISPIFAFGAYEFDLKIPERPSNGIVITNTFEESTDNMDKFSYLKRMTLTQGGVSNHHHILSEFTPTRFQINGNDLTSSIDFSNYSKCQIKHFYDQKCLYCIQENKYLNDKTGLCEDCLIEADCKICLNKEICNSKHRHYYNLNPLNSLFIPFVMKCPHDQGYKYDGGFCHGCPINCKKCYQDNILCDECSGYSSLDSSIGACKCVKPNCKQCQNSYCEICEEGFILHLDIVSGDPFAGYKYNCKISEDGSCQNGYIKHIGTKNEGFNFEKKFRGNFCFNRKCYPGFSFNGQDCQRCSNQNEGECSNIAIPLKITQEGKEYGIKILSSTSVNIVEKTTDATSWNSKSRCTSVSGFNNCLTCDESVPGVQLQITDKFRSKCSCKSKFRIVDPSSPILKCEPCLDHCKYYW